MQQPPIGSERATCQEHGLHYDPRVQAGCVLCRRQSVAPGAAGGSLAPATAKASGLGALGIVLITITCLVGLSMAVMVVRAVVRASQEVATVQKDQSGSRTLGTPHVSRDGIVTLWVPSSWHDVPANGNDDVKLGVAPPGEPVAIVVINEAASDFDPDFTAAQYIALVQKLKLSGQTKIGIKSFGATEPFQIDGRSGVRVSFDATQDGIRRQGNIYAVRGPAHFHQFLTLGVPSQLAPYRAELDKIVAKARLAPGPSR